MKILCVCDQGNNRSVNLSSRLKYWGNDTIPIGLKNTTEDTLDMLFKWSDLIIITAKDQLIPPEYEDKKLLLDIGPDIYPRPYNNILDLKIKKLLEINKEKLCDHK